MCIRDSSQTIHKKSHTYGHAVQKLYKRRVTVSCQGESGYSAWFYALATSINYHTLYTLSRKISQICMKLPIMRQMQLHSSKKRRIQSYHTGSFRYFTAASPVFTRYSMACTCLLYTSRCV